MDAQRMRRLALGRRVAGLRRDAMMTRPELAARTRGIEPDMLAAIEAGADDTLSFDDVCDLADALEVDPSELVRGLP